MMPDSGYCLVAISQKIYVWQVIYITALGVTMHHEQAIGINVICLLVVHWEPYECIGKTLSAGECHQDDKRWQLLHHCCRH